MAIRYHDFDLLIESSGDRFKARVLDSPAGEATVQFKIPFSNTDVENFYTQIGHTRLVESTQMQKMRGFGQQLFDAVITGGVRDKFRESLAEVSRQRNGLRIRLRLVDVPELVNMPWEFMYDTSLSRFLTLSIETPLVRYLDVPRDIQPLTVRPPLKILAVISSPRNFPALNVQREWDNLQEALKRLESHGLVQLTRLEKPTLQALQHQLRRGEYHIFHFIGHGIFSKQYQDGQLLFEDEIKGGDPVSSRDLGILLHDHRQLRLAVLNACEGARTSMEDQFSGTAQSLIQLGLPAVIAMQFRITDIAAITLAREFYSALADGYPVDAALTEARKSIKTHGNELEWGTPVLYMRSPNGQIFDVESISKASLSELKTEPFVDSEIEDQVSRLYTEGLEAFYLKEWETAVTKFKSILAIQSDHKDAAAKIKIAQHQLKLSNLDQQAQSAESKGEWTTAIKALESLAKELPNQASYTSRLENARKQLRMGNLYFEAQQLFKAKKWQAVVQVFREINLLDASYPDPDNLLSRAKDKSAAQELQSELESLYQTALGAIDANNWQTAQDKLRNIQSKQEKFRQTEKLLQRVEGEIKRIEKKKLDEEEVKSLYVQAENLAARKQWNKSLEKIEEILIIQPNFDDPKQLANRARSELEKIQEETEKQEHLAKLYAEAVAFIQATEYQSALDKWNQIRSSDTSYPDRQRVRATAQRMLKKASEPESITRKITWIQNLAPSWWILIVGLAWYAIRLGTLSFTSFLEITNITINEFIRWSLFGFATSLLNLFAFHLFKLNISNQQKLIHIGGWFASSLATPLIIWLFPTFVFRYYIGYTLSGVFYGLVIHYTTPNFTQKPKLSTLLFDFAFGMFAGGASFMWFRDSAGIPALGSSALSLGLAGIISASLVFSKPIAEYAENKSKLTIEKTALSIAGILIAARWLSNVIGLVIEATILNSNHIYFDRSPYIIINLYFILFAVFTVWFMIRYINLKQMIPITRTETNILAVAWIVGTVISAFTCVYLSVDLHNGMGWQIGWGTGGAVIGLGMWLATKKYSTQNKASYLIANILGWGGGLFLSEQLIGELGGLLNPIFGENPSYQIAIQVAIGFAGLVGGLVLAGAIEPTQKHSINWKTVLAGTLGFSIGNLITNIIFYNNEIVLLHIFMWAFIGSMSLAFPSRNYKKYAILGGLGGIGFSLGYQVHELLGYVAFNIIALGIYGLVLSLYTKNFYKILVFSLIAMLAHTTRMLIRFTLENFIPITNPTGEIVVSSISAIALGLILGVGWSYLNSNKTKAVPKKGIEIAKIKTLPKSFTTIWQWLRIFIVFAFSRMIIEIVFHTTGFFGILEGALSFTGAMIIYFVFFGFSTGSALWLSLRDVFISSDWKTWIYLSLISSISLTAFFTGALLANIGAWLWTVAWVFIGICVGLALTYHIQKRFFTLPKRLYWQVPLIWAISFVIGQQLAGEFNILIPGIYASLKDLITRVLETGIYGLIGGLLTIKLIEFENNKKTKQLIVPISIVVVLLTFFAFVTGLQAFQRSFINEPFAQAIGIWGNENQTLRITRNLFTGTYMIKINNPFSSLCYGPSTGFSSYRTTTRTFTNSIKYTCDRNLPTTRFYSQSFSYKAESDIIISTGTSGGTTWIRK